MPASSVSALEISIARVIGMSPVSTRPPTVPRRAQEAKRSYLTGRPDADLLGDLGIAIAADLRAPISFMRRLWAGRAPRYSRPGSSRDTLALAGLNHHGRISV